MTKKGYGLLPNFVVYFSGHSSLPRPISFQDVREFSSLYVNACIFLVGSSVDFLYTV